MNSVRSIWVVAATVVVGISFPSSAIASGIVDLLATPDLETVVVTDTTPAGRLARLPAPGNPVRYVGVNAGFHDFGAIVAGEKSVSRRDVNRTVMKILAKNGYWPAGENQRPDIVVIWTWGTLNTYRVYNELGGGLVATQVNTRMMRWFLGGAKLGVAYRKGDPFHPGDAQEMSSSLRLDTAFPEYVLSPELFPVGGTAERLIATAKQDLYVAVVSAYRPDLDAQKDGQLLWQTRISAPARGFWLPDALPAMLAIAGPFFGHDTPKPVWIRASERFKPDVQIGDAKVLEYIEASEPAVANFGRAR